MRGWVKTVGIVDVWVGEFEKIFSVLFTARKLCGERIPCVAFRTYKYWVFVVSICAGFTRFSCVCVCACEVAHSATELFMLCIRSVQTDKGMGVKLNFVFAVCVCVCVCARVCACVFCVRARARVCSCACVRACLLEGIGYFEWSPLFHTQGDELLAS